MGEARYDLRASVAIALDQFDAEEFFPDVNALLHGDQSCRETCRIQTQRSPPRVPTVSLLPVFVTADYLWEGMEAHYSSHFFEIRMYVYDGAADRYKLRHKYRTAHKYQGIDNLEQVPEVLERERGNIIEVLGVK